MRYGRLYDNEGGPAITLQDRTKALAALLAVRQLVAITHAQLSDAAQAEAFESLNRSLRSLTGLQWSLLTAMQYLTGRKADKALRRWADDCAEAGFSSQVVEVAVALANDFCANGVLGKTMSSGLLVGDYKDRPLDGAAIERMVRSH